jgi:hypothetical protein
LSERVQLALGGKVFQQVIVDAWRADKGEPTVAVLVIRSTVIALFTLDASFLACGRDGGSWCEPDNEPPQQSWMTGAVTAPDQQRGSLPKLDFQRLRGARSQSDCGRAVTRRASQVAT